MAASMLLRSPASHTACVRLLFFLDAMFLLCAACMHSLFFLDAMAYCTYEAAHLLDHFQDKLGVLGEMTVAQPVPLLDDILSCLGTFLRPKVMAEF